MAASLKKFTAESNMPSLETGLTALRNTACYQTESLELGCLLESGRPRMTELSQKEIQSHTATNTRAHSVFICLVLTKVYFLFLLAFLDVCFSFTFLELLVVV